jgi:hypothetical protein
MNYHLRLIKKEMIISSTCYLSPLQELLELAGVLQEKQYFGEVLFDLLCVNGNNPNRFISMFFNGEDFDYKSTKLSENLSKSIINSQDVFYQNHSSFISNSVLSASEQKNYSIPNKLPSQKNQRTA